jgi:hypothetical protein
MSTAGVVENGELLCIDHGHEMPTGVVFYRAQWVNEPRARCETCGIVWAYWDCACELVHDCDGCAP